MDKFCTKKKGNTMNPPKTIGTDEEIEMISTIRECLQKRRYVVFFDDVWKLDFWSDIEHALLDNNKGGRIVLTTRSLDVANFCKTSSYVHVHTLRTLPAEDAWQLFCKRAFKFEFGGHCPADLENLSRKIVKRCDGLPLAIVAIAGLLTMKEKTVDELQKLHDNLSFELESNPHLARITRILSYSYNDLPYYLKSCFLYFGLYPEDYVIECPRLIRQWAAEGFIPPKKDKTPEAIARQYLTELINRSLVQVYELSFRGKVKKCRIHDLFREMILIKMKDVCFGHLSSDESSFTEVTRRLSIIGSHSDDVLTRFKGCRLHSILVFDRKFAEAACSANFKLLKVLDFEFAQDISHLPQCIGNLFHLKYLSVARTSVAVLPRSIGKLENLETLNLKGSGVREIPVEINELHRLQNLLASSPYGVRIPEGFGCLTSLQTLDCIALDDDDEVCREQMAELSKLIQLRKLGISNCPQTRDGTGLCEYIKEMKHLESLHVLARQRGLDIDIGYSSAVSPPESIRSLVLVGKLKKLPEWIIKLQNLAKLVIRQSALEDDPLGVFHNLHSLVTLKLYDGAYTGEEFYFERGLFPRLRCLHVENLRSLYNLEIEEGALPAPEELRLVGMDSLRDVPWGVQHLRNLKMLQVDITRDREKILIGRYYDFMDISPGGSCYHIVQHIPNVWDFRSVSDV